MDNKAINALVKELAIAKNFDAQYSESDQKWFIEKLARRFIAQGLSDSAIKQQVADTVREAKVAIEATLKSDIRLDLAEIGDDFAKLDAWRRVEILYGMIA